jgi:hypothetical protein
MQLEIVDKLRNAFRPVIKPLTRKTKKTVTDLLLRALVKIDKSFIVNAKPQGTWWKDTAIDNPTLLTNHGTFTSECFKANPTLVINEGSIISNSEMLRLLFETAFQKSNFSEIEEAVFNDILNTPSAWSSYEKAISAAEDILKSQLEASNINATEQIKNILKKMEAHKVAANQNRMSYSLEDKPNPNGVFWPDPTMKKRPRSLFDEVPYVQTHNFLDKSTPIGSAGSCFAIEIAHKLQSEGYNYVVTEPYLRPAQKFNNACARWGTIFNTPSFKQLIERAFGASSTPKILWTEERNGNLCYLDPFREDIIFNSVEEYEKDYNDHIVKVREALLKTRVFVITLGVNEVWYLKSTGHVFSRSPWQVASNLVGRKVMSVQDNLGELQQMLDIWRNYNPELKLIVSVSPIPLHATFRGKTTHVIEANSLSKATLRVAAEGFVRANKNVFYLPSYESVMHTTVSPWEADQRHVTRAAVAKVMGLFDKMFLN